LSALLLDYDDFTSCLARFVKKLYLVVGEFVIYRFDLSIYRFAVHDVEADNIRQSLATYKLPAACGVIVLPPN
jgi:hypothetical protein